MIVVTLTTTPANFIFVHKTINTLLSQTVVPDRIVVNVPTSYIRQDMNSDYFDVTISPKHNFPEQLELNFCTDFGSATKFLGLLQSPNKIGDNDIIIVLDDDTSYPDKLVETHVRYHSNCSDTAFSVCSANISETNIVNCNWVDSSACDIVEGWGSYSIRGHMLDKDMFSVLHYPKSILRSDDIFISNYLSKYKKRVIQTDDVYHGFDPNTNTFTSIVPFPHGHAPHQMHISKELAGGSSGDGNEIKYCKALSFLIKKNLCKFPLDEKVKKSILLRDLYYENLSHFLDGESEFVDKIMEATPDISVFDMIYKVEEERVKILKLEKIYEKLLNRRLDPSGYHYFSSLASQGKYREIEKEIKAFPEFKSNSRYSKCGKRVAFIFPHVVNLEGHGCQVRAMEYISYLTENGFHVDVYSQQGISGHTWSETAEKRLHEMGVNKINLYDVSSLLDDYDFAKEMWAKDAVQKINDEEPYDYYVINYSNTWPQRFYNQLPKGCLIVELHDDVNLNSALQGANIRSDDLSYYRSLYSQMVREKDLKPFDICVSISQIEMEAFNGHNLVNIKHLPAISERKNDYSGTPFFMGSSNMFNKHGMGLIYDKVDFDLDLIGSVCVGDFPNNKFINKTGIVDDLTDIFANAPFSICPLVLGTGSKIKIAESLYSGIPVVSMIDSGLSSSIIDGVNGFLCSSLEEFMSRCRQLNKDRKLCSKLGANAIYHAKKELASSIGLDLVFNGYFDG